MLKYNELDPFEQEDDMDPLKDSNRQTGFVDHFWDWDTIQVQDMEELIGEGPSGS